MSPFKPMLCYRLSRPPQSALPARLDRRLGKTLFLMLVTVFMGLITSRNAWSQDQSEPTRDANKESQIQAEERVLRHAVFFKFKPDSSAEETQRVVDAFCALPKQIDSIKSLEWGTNNSPEGLDDGFTHCFLVTFADEHGRAAYLPHAAHQAFVEQLRPILEDVFVVDYWGPASRDPVRPMLRHAVFFQFKDDADPAKVSAVGRDFAALPSKIDAINGFEWGVNNSPEPHADGFTHCFLVTFPSEIARSEYLPHPHHQAFVESLKPVLEKVRVLDYWAKPAAE